MYSLSNIPLVICHSYSFVVWVQLLRMGQVNAVVMPVFATVICILLVAYHLKDPTQDGQVCVAVCVLVVIHGSAWTALPGWMMRRIVCVSISMSLPVGACGCCCSF